MHEYISRNDTLEYDRLANIFRLITSPLCKDYVNARNKLIIDLDPPRLNFRHIEDPHMLESYYALSKIITINDFR